MTQSIGACIGSSSVSLVKVTKDGFGIINIDKTFSISHNGDPKPVFESKLYDIALDNIPIVVTGRKFRSLLKAHTISEPKAVENSIDYLNLGGVKFSIASLGAENFIVYCVSEKGSIETVLTGNKCASGTGEFFLQQIRRMDLSVEEAVKLSNNDNAHFVSGRCSVFCKSDCTHAQGSIDREK